MLKNKVQLETKIGDRDYKFECDPGAPLTEVYEALNVFRSYAYGRLKEMEEQQKAKSDGESKPESSCCS